MCGLVKTGLILDKGGLQLFQSAICSPNSASVNEGSSAAAFCQAKGSTPRCQSVHCLFDEDINKQPASVPRGELYFKQRPNDHETTIHGSKPGVWI